ncbi:Cloroperoxidase [Atractiella rhizophila]|nr:Cloroperoxidase [Atractiella rhizophila]
MGDWRPPKPTDSRCVCPMLNSLANQGILPRDGRNLTPALLDETLQKFLNLAPDLSASLTTPLSKIVREDGKLELKDVNLHNFIEHDASLVHDDTVKGEKYAPTETNQRKVDELLALSSDRQVLRILEFACARVIRENESPPLAEAQKSLAASESAAALLLLGDGEKIDLGVARGFFADNRLPEDWKKPLEPVTETRVGEIAGRILQSMEAISMKVTDQSRL